MNLDDIVWPHRDSMPWLKRRLIYLTRHGSQAYGTNLPSSDLDVKGVAIPPDEYFLGFVKQFEQAESKEPDMVIYDIRKFMSLAADCNPNIIEVLFTDPEDHLITTTLGERLRNERHLFLSRKAKHTFSGYAVSQLKRIQRHYEWLHHPPKVEPTRAMYGLPETTLIPADQRAAVAANVKKKLQEWDGLLDLDPLDPASTIAIRQKLSDYVQAITLGNEDKLWIAAARTIGVPDNFIELMVSERGYNSAREQWVQYQTWKQKRNPARAALEAKFGYDTKHAMHLVRLMRMCEEILREGKVVVRRPDAAELLEIRAGVWTYQQVIEWADRKDRELDEVYKTSPLPRAPDRQKLDQLCLELVRMGTQGPPDLMYGGQE